MDALIRSVQLAANRRRLSDSRSSDVPVNGAAEEWVALRDKMETQLRLELAAHAQKLYDSECARAYAEGHAFGVREAKDTARRELVQTREQLEAEAMRALAVLEQAHQAAVSKLESSVGAVAFAAVCRLVGQQATSQAFVLGLVAQTCNELRSEAIATVRLHPRDIDLLRELLRGDELRIQSLGLTVIRDESLKLGGCVIETPSGHYDGALASQLSRLHAVLTGATEQTQGTDD